MKIYEKIILLSVCAALVLLTVGYQGNETVGMQNIFLESQGTLALNNNDLGSAEKNVYRSINGIGIEVLSYENAGSIAKTERIEITANSQKFMYNITLNPGEKWRYFRINDIVVVPSSHVFLDLNKTSYFPLSRQLVVAADKTSYTYTGKYTIDIYASKGPPGFIDSGKKISWNYNSTWNVINIEAEMPVEFEVYWINFEKKGTVFIEDKKRSEILLYEISQLTNYISDREDEKNSTEELKESLKSYIEKISRISGNLSEENLMMRSDIKKIGMNILEMNNRITSNVVIAAPKAALWFFVSLILVLLLAESTMFSKDKISKGEINEK